MQDQKKCTGVIVGLALCAGLSGAATAQVSSFDTDAEGWTTLNDATGFTWTGSLGNPAGAIRARDLRQGAHWFFAAPTMYLGDRSAVYGGTLDWDILGIVGNHTSASVGADVMLTGGGLEIGIELNVLPLNSGWTSWSALLDESAGWSMVSSLSSGGLLATAVTEADLRTVLGSLDGLYIRGEYTSGSDSTALDNVNLVPAPGAAALLALGGLGTLRRRR